MSTEKLSLHFATTETHPRIHKLEHYFSIYDRYFNPYRDKPVKVLEIGVQEGGSLHLWKSFFGETSTIYGIDIDERVMALNSPENSIVVSICDQSNPIELTKFAKQHGPFDIIIDDGGHQMNQQINSFEVLYPHLSKHGCYLVEDTHTSYWKSYKGGLRRPGTFIEYAKHVSDYVNCFHFRDNETFIEQVDLIEELRLTLVSVHFYDSIVVFLKGNKCPPVAKFYYGNERVEVSIELSEYN